MVQPRHMTLAVLMLLASCGRTGPTPPAGELKSALARPTVTGEHFDPGSLTAEVTVVTFWSPS